MEPPLNRTSFNLDVGGIVGFLGGEEAISAMESMHFNKYRKWLGWYNSPGSYTIAKHYGKLARSRIWDGIYPGPNDEPAKLLGLDGEHGPRYRGIVSGTTLNNTGHVGHVFAQYCCDVQPAPSWYSLHSDFDDARQSKKIPTTEDTKPSAADGTEMSQLIGRQSRIPMDQGQSATDDNLGSARSANLSELGRPTTDGVQPGRRKTKAMNVVVVNFEEKASSDEVGETETLLELGDSKSPLWSIAIASVPISFNIICCILCGLYDEWFAFGVILYGILCNGIACYFIGSAKIYLKHTIPSPHSPPGNGILEYESDTLIVCRGSEKAINHVVKGKFIVRYGKDGQDKTYHKIGFSAMSLTTQFIAQLFLIPLSGLFGQIMFLSTLAISWLYNAYLSSIDKGQLQQQLLMKNLPLKDVAVAPSKVKVQKLQLPTRTSAVVFAMLCGLPGELRNDSASMVKCSKGITGHLLPTDTRVWTQWQESVAAKVRELSEGHSAGTPRPVSGLFNFSADDCEGLQQKEKKLLKDLLDDACGGYESYYDLLVNTAKTTQAGSPGSPA